MKSATAVNYKSRTKASTGIPGFDKLTDGGLPRHRTTLMLGGPGTGKTLFALQFLVHGAQECKEPGVFIAFEESPARLMANAEGLGWPLAALQPKKLQFIDAQQSPDLIQSGDFDLGGLLAALHAQTTAMKARRVVFDALDNVLALLPDDAARRREVHRLHQWLLSHGLTALITLKSAVDEKGDATSQNLAFMQYMVDCSVLLNHRILKGVSQRGLRVQKYRGSSFDEDEAPLLIGTNGLEVAVASRRGETKRIMTSERVSSGVARLDTMLGGGFFRGASVLITGSPGTAKTTLSGAFAEAACQRRERTTFVSFDSDANEVIRDLASVGIRLEQHRRSGMLCMMSARVITGSADTYLIQIKTLVQQHRSRCLVVDPVSTWWRFGGDQAAYSVAARLHDWSKSEGITLICTRLLDQIAGQPEDGTSIQISTLADTWIHLNYLVQAGERNRELSIIKSRGMAHSNQVRELILGNSGVTLADTYTAGGEVLMGTLRWEKESADRLASDSSANAAKAKQVRLDAEEAALEVQVKSLQLEIVAKQQERALLASMMQSREREASRVREQMLELRGADTAKRGRK